MESFFLLWHKVILKTIFKKLQLVQEYFWYDAKYLYMARIGLLQGGGGEHTTHY